MKKLPLVARILLGLVFFVFGLNGFFHFIPMQPMPEPVMNWFSAMMATKYFMPLVAGTQTLCGLLLLVGMYVPLALVALAPVLINILMFHIFVERSGLGMAVVL